MLFRRGATSLVLVSALALLAPSRSWSAPRVEFELITEPGVPVTAPQRWLAVFKDLDLAGVRIRSGRPGETAQIERRGTEQAPVYHVTGILTAGNALRVPGGSFTSADKTRLADWIAQVRAGGQPGGAPAAAFGLTAAQLVTIHDKLSVRVGVTTRGKSIGQIFRSIADLIDSQVASTPAATRALAGSDQVEDELLGLASGTALAAAIRPLGLVLVPQDRAGTIVLTAMDVREARESWPIGWPPQQRERDLVPKLYEFLDVEIADTPLAESVDAIRGRLGMPLLYDHNALARHRIDPEAVHVSYPAGRTYYKRVLDRILFQARLKAELRVDEAKRPFLWITSVTP